MSLLSDLTQRDDDADPATDVSSFAGASPWVVPKVNLLPPEIAEEQRFKRIQLLLAGAVAASIVVVGGLYLMASSSVSSAQGDLDAANARSISLNAEVARYADVPRVKAELSTAQTQLSAAMGQEVRWSSYLNTLGLTVPRSSALTSLTISQTVPGLSGGGADGAGPVSPLGTTGIASVQYGGSARNNDAVALFLDAISKQEGNVDPYFSSAQTAADDRSGRTLTTFQASTTVTADALSNRFTGTVN